jgi:glycerol-3-phosphate O-acyltransferase
MPGSPGAIIVVVLLALAIVVVARLVSGRVERSARRSARAIVRRYALRINRFSLASRAEVKALLLQDPAVVRAIERTSSRDGVASEQTARRVSAYLDEIVPRFSLLAYYRLGAGIARAFLNFLYRIAVNRREIRRFHEGSPRDAVIVYVMNHRSNADYVMVGYMLMKYIALSYAVGEWARVWPLETLFRSFGSYFVRRRYREELYQTVLERYVQLITRQGVTQGIFLEGGLSRDGAFRDPKIGLLDYILLSKTDLGFSRPLYFVPLGLNYDRVIEDRSLIAEARGEATARSTWSRARTTFRYLFKNTWRALRGHFKKFGYAAANFGEPLDVNAYLKSLPIDILSLPREARLAEVKKIADLLMSRIARAMPVLPVPLVAAACLEYPGSAISREDLEARIDQKLRRFREEGAALPIREKTGAAVLSAALSVLGLRGVLVADPSGKALSYRPEDRDLLAYYARSIERAGMPDLS